MAGPGKKSAHASLSRLPLGAKIGIGAGLAILVGVAYFVMGYSEVSSQIAAQKRQEVQLRQQLANARESEAAYLKDLADLTEKKQRQRDLNKILPETAETPAFLSALQGVANVSGVALNSWDPIDEVNQQFFAKVPMKLVLSGRFHQIAKFFYGVGQLDRIINLENIVLRDPKREGDETIIVVEALATAFRALAPKPAAAGTNPQGKK
ncbi:MAG: type 4a pilus biogenesis protein PilO [Myxococcales bacterium]|nr:type 4a pilus biogenesis protein PilO [Polyangiaceae bacterium]MDW8248348.1 type 4a pilus biogenesis protein PilO [Myxococcales bacterium]